jgi:nucleoid-associated protein YgaU
MMRATTGVYILERRIDMPVMQEGSENQNQGSSAEQEAREQLRKAQEEKRQRIEEAKAKIRARSASKQKTYTVQDGDTLGKIAQSQLGDGSRWKEIWEANKDEIPDPDVIQVGQELVIP